MIGCLLSSSWSAAGRHVDTGRIAAIGFCFGGQCVLDLARSGADIAGVASFHGLFDPPGLPPQQSRPRSWPTTAGTTRWSRPKPSWRSAKELTAAGADWQIHAYGHVGHGFTNPKAAVADPGRILCSRRRAPVVRFVVSIPRRAVWVTAFCALLRAVNIRQRKLLMSDLKAIGEELGLESPRTFIASGNLLFNSSKGEAKLCEIVERRLGEHMGAEVPVMVRTAQEMADAVAANPFSDEPGNRVYAIFLDDQPMHRPSPPRGTSRTSDWRSVGARFTCITQPAWGNRS